MTTSNSPPSTASVNRPVIIRSVWANNLVSELKIISDIVDQYPFISMDTEFPGVIYGDNAWTSHARYDILKSNVDALKIIQVGFTLSDANGNLPTLEAFSKKTGLETIQESYVWEFNFREFNPDLDPHAKDSIKMLKDHGIDFKKNNEFGIDVNEFSELFLSSGLVMNDIVSWITFHGSSDFAYLLKILTGKRLPNNLKAFLDRVRLFFGDKVYDIKHMVRFGRYGNTCLGGLNKVAKALKLNRVAGNAHHSGSDSLLAWHVFLEIKELWEHQPQQYANVLHGFELS
ncbi:Poly(A)-specific ribonuclease [Heracleum sosnowskyi]|uniref:poly(A)-specific ribonuclease n=1 Tax=Heracleum sosnowskyi TaxID=360622 RepID=A0AAD8IRN2_9APIA|nr:Poly(A)-specific ribonuclease [Heracleum sosnowskyi]